MAIKTKWKFSPLALYIHEESSLKSRFEIDRQLLEGGYTPQQVEAAWQLLQPTSVEAVAEAWQVLGNSRQNPWRKPLSMRQHGLYFGFLVVSILLALFPAWLWDFSFSFYFYPINGILGLVFSVGTVVIWLRQNRLRYRANYKPSYWLYNAIIVSFLGISWWLLVIIGSLSSNRFVASINVKERDYHLRMVSNCYYETGCFTDIYLYNCQFFNVICPLSADVPYGYGDIATLLKENKSPAFAYDPSTDKVNLLRAGQVIYAFDP